MDGGSGVIITTGAAESPSVLHTIKKRGAALTCSYDEEVHALEESISWLTTNHADEVIIVTDSQSLCLALLGDGFELDELRFKLRSFEHRVIIQWVPGHKEIPGNDMVDAVAKEAAKMMDAPELPVWQHSAAAFVKGVTKDLPPENDRIKQVYKNFSKKKEIEEVLLREDQTMLAKLRSGHSTLLAAYRKRIGMSESDTCCGIAPQTLIHWMCECTANEDIRVEIFGREDFRELGSLTKFPKKAIAFAKRTLRR